ncbi:MAG: hypothetical protein ACRDJF_02930 [Actinomycetota bacterium]
MKAVGGSPRVEPEPEERQTQFRWFVTLWVMAFSFHYFEQQPFDVGPVLLAGIPCLLFPSSVAAFAAFLLTGGLVVVIHLPAASNHLVLALMVHLAFAAGAVVILRSRSGPAARRDGAWFVARWVEMVRTPVGITLIVVYFFGVFHKLNTSFFDPSVSCAGSLLNDTFRFQGLDPGRIPSGFVVAGALGTVVVEAMILVCLALARWQRWGVLIGVAFHSLLTWASFYDFAGFVFALYVLLLPRETVMGVRRPETLRQAALAGWAAHAGVSFSAALSQSASSPLGLRWHTLQVATWFFAVAPLVVPLVRASFSPAASRLAPPRWKLRPAWLLLVPVLAFLNGSTSYLGLKTVANYSMFSNLRTEEGRTNHLLPVVGALQIADFQSDTVDVQDIDFPSGIRLGWFERLRGGFYWFQHQTRWARTDTPVRVPWFELRRAVLLWKDAGMRDIRIRYKRGGVEHEVPDAGVDPNLAEPLPPLARRLMAFRAIEDGNGPVLCRW